MAGYKFASIQPRVGIECKFYMADEPSFKGYFDHGGAHEGWSVINSETGKHYKGKELDSIESWEYIKLN